MNWTPESKYHMTREDRAFTVCKYAINGEWFYELWAGKQIIATRLPSADAAKAMCAQREAA